MLFVSAFVFPLLLGALTVGTGLLLERLAGVRLAGALLAPLGFAGIVCLTQLGTMPAATAQATAPLVVLLALAGFALGRARLAGWRDRWRPALPPALAGVAAYCVFAGPVVLTGKVAWTGYGVDTTPAFHWLGAEHLAEHGHDFSDAGYSAATLITAGYFDRAYPSGGNTALGVTGSLTGVELAWLWQPFLAFLGTLLALTLYALVREAVSSRWLAAGIAFVAAQPALLYGFFLQGQVKELIATLVVPLLAALLLSYVRALPGGWRAVLPLAVAGAAGVGATGVGFAAWLGPPALLALVFAVRRLWPRERVRLGWHVGAFAVVLVGLALPSLSGFSTYLSSVHNLLTNEPPLGSLKSPLSPLQTAGVWLSGDYREAPAGGLQGLSFALVGAVGAGALFAGEWAVRRRVWALAAYAVTAVPGCLVLAARGTPWLDAKAMVLAAPLVLVLGLVGVTAALGRNSVRLGGWLLAGAISAGVLASNALLYHSTQIAPSARYVELTRVAERFAGDGLTLRPDFDDYALFFARDLRPNAPGDVQAPLPPQLLKGLPTGYGLSYRLDDLKPGYVMQHARLLLQRSPFESRPPATFRLVWSGHYYELWEKGAGEVLAHARAGSRWSATGAASCRVVGDLAKLARREGGILAVPERAPTVVLRPSRLTLPGGWTPSPDDPELLVSEGPGRLGGRVSVPHGGRWTLWLAGSFTRPVTVRVDGREVATLDDDIKYAGLAQEGAQLPLAPGGHRIEIVRSGGSLAPGNGAGGAIGPLALTPGRDLQRDVRYLAPAEYKQACGRPVDWIEVVRGIPGSQRPA